MKLLPPKKYQNISLSYSNGFMKLFLHHSYTVHVFFIFKQKHKLLFPVSELFFFLQNRISVGVEYGKLQIENELINFQINTEKKTLNQMKMWIDWCDDLILFTFIQEAAKEAKENCSFLIFVLCEITNKIPRLFQCYFPPIEPES